MTVRSLQELPDSEMYAGLGRTATYLPATVLRTATSQDLHRLCAGLSGVRPRPVLVAGEDR